ncbi:MAG: serine/threonine-protein kinase [Acidobacteria bacterium]|nr:serine/threonine-protein kinase [Acidobacteriota bacterium]
MTPERLRKIELLFHEARERAPAERDAFLVAACTDDPLLLREVESLLAQIPAGVLNTPVGALVAELVPPPAPRLAPGSLVGPYRIERLIDVGGMGEVYRARDTTLGRDVAIKILPRHFTTDPQRLARFEREAQLLAALNHPNIGAIYGLEAANDVRALVLELVEGDTLAARIQRGPAPVTDALTIAGQIADALDAAHEKGIIHRDLKPSNIKVTPDGVVKVLDFGLAKAATRESPSATVTVGGTQDGTILGTAAYMSPEQARGQAVDKRTDIWAFGCVLYEMLTGHVPFAAATVSDTIVAILDREPRWAALPSTTPPTVARLLHRALEKDPKRRLRDIADARADLDDALEGGTAPAMVVGRPPVAHSLWSRWAAIVLLAVASALAGWGVSRLNPAPDNPLANATFTRLTNFEGDEAEATLSPDGKFAAFLSDRDGPLDVWLTQVGSGRFLNLTRESHMPGMRPVRNVGFSGDGSQVWFGGAPVGRMRIIPMMGGPPRPLLVDRTVEVVWSSDGARMVYHTDAPGDPMFVVDRTGVGAKQIFVDPIVGGHNHHQAWSPDGRWIYFARGIQDVGQMDLWRIAAGGGLPERLTGHNAFVGFPTPIDDRNILYVAQDHEGSGPWLWALDTYSRATHRVAYGTEQYLSIASSADHRRLVAAVANPSASLWTVPILDRPAEDADVKPMPLPTVRALAPRLAGRSLFYLSSQGTRDGLWRFEDGKAVEILKGSDEALFEPPAVSADGRQLAVILRRDGKLRLHVLSADGGDLQSFAELIDIRGSVCWSPDGKWIVAGGIDDRGLGLFKIPLDHRAPVRLIAGTARDPVWSSSGDLIVYTAANVSVDAPLLAIRPDGTHVELPAIRLRVGGKRYRFLPNGLALVYAQGPFPAQDFWLLDLATKKSRQLSRLNNSAATQSFDVTVDGKQIVFDRVRENSDVVLIDRAP